MGVLPLMKEGGGEKSRKNLKANAVKENHLE